MKTGDNLMINISELVKWMFTWVSAQFPNPPVLPTPTRPRPLPLTSTSQILLPAEGSSSVSGATLAFPWPIRALPLGWSHVPRNTSRHSCECREWGGLLGAASATVPAKQEKWHCNAIATQPSVNCRAPELRRPFRFVVNCRKLTEGPWALEQLHIHQSLDGGCPERRGESSKLPPHCQRNNASIFRRTLGGTSQHSLIALAVLG